MRRAATLCAFALALTYTNADEWYFPITYGQTPNIRSSGYHDPGQWPAESLERQRAVVARLIRLAIQRKTRRMNSELKKHLPSTALLAEHLLMVANNIGEQIIHARFEFPRG